MSIKEDLLTSKKYIGSLMRAQNPKTGEDISSATLRSEEAFDALSYVSRTLDDAIEGLEQRIEEDVAAKLDKARAEAYEKAKEELIPKYEQLLKEASSGKKVKLEAPKAPKYTKEQEPVPEMYEIELRGHKAEVPITFAKIFLADVQTNINNAFAEENVVVSLNYLLNLLKDKGLIALGRLGNQNKLIPTKIGNYYGVSLGFEEGETSISKQVPVFNERAQLLIYKLLSSAKIKKAPFEYIPNLIKCVPTTDDEVSLSDIIASINETYKLENMVKLQYDAAIGLLVKRGIMIPNPDGEKPKYICAEGKRKNGIIFYPADARFNARTAFNERGQKFVLKELAWLLEE